jgi:hypothetical protein
MMPNPYLNPKSLPYRFRQRRFHHVQALIQSILQRKGSCRILDIGGEEMYWNVAEEFIDRNNIEIHLLNITPPKISRDKFVGLRGDAAELGHLQDNAFDLVHSNSVIEHVGNWRRMHAAASHMRRLAPAYYVQTPYFGFPFEPHFRFPLFHWMPEQIRYRLLLNFNIGFCGRQDSVNSAMEAIQEIYLLDARQFSDLFPDATIIRERLLLLTKSLMAIRTGTPSGH